jgi:hypothetical protein
MTNLEKLITTMIEDQKINCDVCTKLGIDEYCQSRPCVETVLEWIKEEEEE